MKIEAYMLLLSQPDLEGLNRFRIVSSKNAKKGKNILYMYILDCVTDFY